MESKNIAYNSPVESIIEVWGLESSLSLNATISLQVWVAHPENSDLVIRLYGPDESYIILSNQRGGGNENVFNGTLFIDSASDSVSNYFFRKNEVVSPLQPEQPFSNFRGKNPNGQWKLWVSDGYPKDSGKLYGVILNIQGIHLYQIQNRTKTQ